VSDVTTRLIEVQAPFNRSALLSYLAFRAIPTVEEIDRFVYRRVVSCRDKTGVLSVDLSESQSGGTALVECEGLEPAWATDRARVLIDAHSDVAAIERHLSRDPVIEPVVASQRGVRIPGTLDPFDLSVRCVLGQQISVTAAKTLATRLVERFGEPASTSRPFLTRAFPSALVLAEADLESCGVMRPRANAIRRIAALVATGELRFSWRDRLEDTYRVLLDIKGVGPWTAAYIALRALGDADASMATDLGVRQFVGDRRGPATSAEVSQAALRWKPFRGYAAVHIWTSILSRHARPGPVPG
jgi:AraC family transcriptional regulator of adaptative response / DNA-3-methyladenine glycosylase II